jgi:hypothetical protein
VLQVFVAAIIIGFSDDPISAIDQRWLATTSLR